MMFNKFRTNVLPNGLGYTWSKSEGIQEVAQVLQWRSEELAKNGLDQTDVLPFALQKIVQRKHYEMWRNDPQNQEMIKGKNTLHDWVTHKVERELLSLHRVFCRNRFGGREWMHLIIALGPLNDDILAAAEEAYWERYNLHKVTKGDAWVTEEDLAQKRASAPPRGDVKGINHKTSEAKRLREDAKSAQKQFKQAQANQNWSGWTKDEWSRWVEEKWRVAEEASQQAGVEYKGRDKEWKCKKPEDATFVGLTIKKWREARQASASSRVPAR